MLGVRKLTATSYAILGLLGLRPWSAYELTKQGRRSLHFCWPRAETRMYQEPKNLVEHGLAKATTTAQGRRTRTEYAITPKGRRALRAWLGQPSAPPRLESEALLRVFFAEYGTKEELLATLTELEGQALALRREAVRLGAEYLAGTAPFPERIHILGVIGRFTLDHTALVAEWARWARAEIEHWPDVASAEVSPEVARAFEAALAESADDPPVRGSAGR
ncbi:MAG TPA: PadR family transcriptional regulator [Acidimicrobiia bacterium]|nr:PadR family transcriptional regulator [Acidimicrobiia bacterium]